MMFGSGIAERYHKRFFDHVPRPAGVTFTSRTDALAGFNVAGPKSRQLLERLTNASLSNDDFPFFQSRQLTVAGIDALALRLSFTGDLGWELYVDAARQLDLYDALLDAGRDLGVRPVGSRSLLSLRVEKGYGSWSREYSPEYWPHEVGLDRLVKTDKGDFIGRRAYLELAERPPREKLVMLEIDAETADASGGEPIFTHDGTPAGRITSGAYGHTVDRSLGLAMISRELLDAHDAFDVYVLGRPHGARVLAQPAFDPTGSRLRA
jgi:dimethylglycine dehydrogenase